jgi:tetraacyldisaccharide 4'-kinase
MVRGNRHLQSYLTLIGGQRRGPWPTLARGLLWAASVPYGLAVRLRNWAYDRHWKQSYRPAVPVVSVGNLTLGGTGKTPCVEYVASFYRQLDVRVAILSRGYGGDGGPNDEALLLEENLPDVPHLQGSNRVALAGVAVEELESEVLVLDDGFQHRQLARTLDLVLIDATAPWGHGHLCPRGLLREPPRNLRRAGAVLLSRCDQVAPESLTRLRKEVGQWAPRVPVIETTHRPLHWVNAEGAIRPLEAFRGKPVAAVCGIGNPKAFRRTLDGLGVAVGDMRVFPDHHPYRRTDVEALRDWARQLATDCVIVTTQKDLVKLRLTHLGERELWALRIRLHVAAEQDVLDRKLKEALG